MQLRWSRDPYAYFRGFLALALAAAVLALTAMAAAVLQRFYTRDTVAVTVGAVDTHFDMLFDPEVFTGTLADARRFDRMVRMHLGIYDIVDTRFFSPDGRVVYSYDPARLQTAAGPADAGRLRRALAGEVITEWLDGYMAPDGQRYGTVLRIITPVHGEAPAAAAAGRDGEYGNGAAAANAGHGHTGYGGVIGVVEVMRNATPGLALVRSVQALAAAVLLLVGVVLYLGLGRIFWHSTRRIRKQSRDLEHALGQLEGAYDTTLRTLSRALDARDSETEGHSLRVGAYTVRLAGQLGVPERDLGNLFRGALLHDVGKIAVPDAILRKPGPLTDAEWAEMRRHPTAGYGILRDVPFLQEALSTVLHHHERWDGSGYPTGLAGEDIPLGARIFAVIDTLDAITSDRPYRAARSLEDARQEIRRCSGTQFDPQVVDAFLAVPAAEWLELRRLVADGHMPGVAAGAAGAPSLPLAGD